MAKIGKKRLETLPAWENIFSWAEKNFFLGRKKILSPQAVHGELLDNALFVKNFIGVR
ncbi:MAG: hypothetical protein K6F20_09510 [Bacteroidaceae bacterium]|nr:hypothetical protein [Bacteroidaceae bacterium]